MHAQNDVKVLTKGSKLTLHTQKDLKYLTQDTKKVVTPTSDKHKLHIPRGAQGPPNHHSTGENPDFASDPEQTNISETTRNLHKNPWQQQNLIRPRGQHIGYQQTRSRSFKGEKTIVRHQTKNESPRSKLHTRESSENLKKNRSSHSKAQPSTKNEDQTIPTHITSSKSIGST
jgi:hypothetical protein